MSSNVITIKPRRPRGYLTVPTEIVRSGSGVSAEAVGVWFYLYTRIDDWKLHRDVVMKQFKLSSWKFNNICKEIQLAGYLLIQPKREGKHFTGWIWEVAGERDHLWARTAARKFNINTEEVKCDDADTDADEERTSRAGEDTGSKRGDRLLYDDSGKNGKKEMGGLQHGRSGAVQAVSASCEENRDVDDIENIL